MLAFVDLEERVPADHPLRAIKALADEALERLSPEFDRMYADVGRPSIPPERLLKASLLIGLFSVRSERAFCEELESCCSWFLGMQLMERSLDATVFTKNRQRLLEHRVGQQLFDEVVLAADRRSLLSDEHFTVDGRLIERQRASRASSRERAILPQTTATGVTPRWTFMGTSDTTPVAVQDKCPSKWPAEMSLGQVAMVSDDDVAGAARSCRVGGPSASR